tara:strand:- start:197 stop:820 length:624 start_codon:yes stop_codon:yes gene_type:complete
VRESNTSKVFFIIILFLVLSSKSYSHGGVFLEDDQCVIQIGFFKAHFTVYQPVEYSSREFCEDLPGANETLFVLDYLHDSLKYLPVDFRIIRNMTGLKQRAKWEDITRSANMDEQTVYYHDATIASDGSFVAKYKFLDNGHYIGIITTQQQDNDKIYRAVFPFKVGASNIGYLPLFVFIVLLVEMFYLYSSGTLLRWWNKYTNRWKH